MNATSRYWSAALVAACLYVRGQSAQAQEVIHPFAPNFSAPLADKLKLFSLADLPAKDMLIVHVGGIDGQGVTLAMDTLRELRKKYAEKGLHVLTVAMGSEAATKAFVKKHRPDWPVALDDGGDLREHYVPRTYYPWTFVVITRERRALSLSEQDVKKTCAALERVVAEEMGRPGKDRPSSPVAFYPVAETITAVPVRGGSEGTITFGKLPTMFLITNAGDRASYQKALSEVHKKYGSDLRIVAGVFGSNIKEAEGFAKDKPYPVFWLRGNPPACFGPNVVPRLALVTGNGRVFRLVNPSIASYATVLDFYARLLTTAGSLPAELDRAAGANLAHRANGGRIERASSASNSAETLIDGLTGRATWESVEKQAEIVLSFLKQQPATFDRVLLDNHAALQDVEVLAGDDGPAGTFRALGTFRLENRTGQQALAVPSTKAKFVKVRLLSTFAEKKGFALGEIHVEESAGAKPALPERMAAAFAQGFKDEFTQGSLSFWQQVDLLAERHPDPWTIQSKRLVPPSSNRHTGDYRATALLHAPVAGDYRLQAVVKPIARASGLIFGFQDWNNFDRVLILRGPVHNDPNGNSIRLERWRKGRAEVLSLHGEWFALDQDVRLEVIRQGKSVAVKVQGQLIMNVTTDEAARPGRVGLFAANNDGCSFAEVALTPLAAPLTLPDMPALSTAAGASVLFLNSQGSSKERLTWASNLLRVPALGPAGTWEAATQDGQPPEVIFAFKDREEVVLKEVGFTLPPAQGVALKNRAPQVQVLVSRETNVAAGSFQSVGTFDLADKDGLQMFALKQPATCRFLMVRLLKNDGGTKYALARVTVGLVNEKPAKTITSADRGRVELEFAEPSAAKEQEPNDTLEQANALLAGKELEGVIRPGEVDFFRLPDAPLTKGRPVLHLQMRALPWLRLNASVLDEKGKPLGLPLVKSGTGQSVVQMRSGKPVPRYVRVEMPQSSISLVIDTSGSMKPHESDVRAAVKEFLQGVSATEEIEVLRFGNKVASMTPFTRDKKVLGAIAGRIQIDRDATALYEGMLQSLQNLSTREGSGAIVLLSDGMNTVSGADFADLCRRLRRQPVPIYVIGVGMDLYEYDAVSGNTCIDLLKNLALQTGGRFYFAPRSEELAELYRKIADELRGQTRYRVTAKWQTTTLVSELVDSPATAAVAKPLLGPLPPAAAELAAHRQAGSLASDKPLSGGLPPAVAELAEGQVTKVQLALKQPPVPLPLELVAALPMLRPITLRLNLPPDVPELMFATPQVRRQQLALLTPIPEFGRLRVSYKPAKGETTVLPPTVRPAFELILDCSGSMKELVGKEAKYLIARRVMHEVVDAMPNDAHVGLRLFGYMGFWDRKKEPKEPDASDKRYDTDSDVVVSIGPLDQKERRKLIKEWVNWATPKGKTPLVYSLLQALKDFPADWKGPKTVILISDGMETCGGKLEDVAKAFGKSDIGMVIHVVGFDVREPEEVKQLQAIAKIGRGNFYNATDARQLAAALRQAVERTSFVIHDAEGKNIVAGGLVNGTPIELAAGAYRVSIPGTRVASVQVQVGEGGVFELSLNEAGSLVPVSKKGS